MTRSAGPGARRVSSRASATSVVTSSSRPRTRIRWRSGSYSASLVLKSSWRRSGSVSSRTMIPSARSRNSSRRSSSDVTRSHSAFRTLAIRAGYLRASVNTTGTGRRNRRRRRRSTRRATGRTRWSQCASAALAARAAGTDTVPASTTPTTTATSHRRAVGPVRPCPTDTSVRRLRGEERAGDDVGAERGEDREVQQAGRGHDRGVVLLPQRELRDVRRARSS